MPTGTPFHGFIPPFPVRVDEFGPTPGFAAVPALHLLSHTHSDHIVGLSAKSFASTVICSADAKEMLLRHEVYNERALRDMNLREEARLSRTFGHLRVPPLLRDGRYDYSGSRDLLVCHLHSPINPWLIAPKKTLPLNTPTKIELSDKQVITLTLFDANHCPGAVMYIPCLFECERWACFESFLSGFSWKAPKALFSIPETSVLNPGFSMIYVATPFYNPTLLPHKRLEAPCLDNATASTKGTAYIRR